MNQQTIDEFEEMNKKINNPVATAIIMLSMSIEDFTAVMKDFDDPICKGIRHGLFGGDANPYCSIETLFGERPSDD